MAQNETWLNHDLSSAVKVQYLDGNLFSMDNAGNLIGVILTKDGVAYSGGGTVSANVIRADGGTVAVTGALSGNVATVVLPQAAYAVPGVASVVIKLTVSGEVTTIGAVVANVYESTTSTTIDPGTIIPSIQTLVNQINTAVSSIPADYSALWTSLAPAFSTSTAYTAGQYVTYNGGLYRFTADHAVGSWSSSDVTAAKLGNDISDLKSAFNKTKDDIIPLYSSTMEQGALSAVDTSHPLNEVDGTTRIRSSDYAVWHSGNKLVLKSGYEARLFLLASNYNYITLEEWAQTVTSNNSTAAYAKVVIRKSNNESITPDEATGAIVYDDFGLIVIHEKADKSDFDNTKEQCDENTSTINIMEPLLIDESFFVENGSIATQGEEIDAYSRIRTGYMRFKTYPNTIEASSGYQFRSFAYDNELNYEYATDWLSSVTFESSNKFIRLVIKKTNGDDIFPNEFNTAISSGLTNAYCLIPSVQLKNKFPKNNIVDVIIFSGQSNMAGRGITNEEHTESYPTVPDGYAYEFKAITDPTKLTPLAEPFGKNENKTGGINDGSLKTGGLVASFAIAYYKGNGNIPLVGISASKGDSGIDQWQPNASEGYLSDALQRLSDCISFLTAKGFVIRHKYLCWCQGEHDYGLTSTYAEKWQTMYNAFANAGIEKCLFIRIGNNANDDSYATMISTQTEMAKTNKDIVMVSTDFAGMKTRGMMKDQYHYYQDAYNECGKYAGVNSAIFATTGKEPTMYDPEYNNLYFCNKN